MTFDYKRTHTLGELRAQNEGETVTLSGWVHKRRDLGKLIFIDLRDRYGITQLIFDPEENENLHSLASTLRHEWVISVQGSVLKRREGMENKAMSTGEIEVAITNLQILSKSKVPPFSVFDEDEQINEELRLKYRYLDLRKGPITRNLEVRHKAILAIRNFLDEESFLEIETPIMSKSTPEGAREYLVPSRIQPGSFYALPQSPQIFKQILMISGVDRYFQIARCFRDEDLRTERQPEFTQVDIELSFATPPILMELSQKLMGKVFSACLGIDIPSTFPVMTYHECMEKYGCDKPDLRFGMELVRIDDIAKESSFSIFKSAVEAGGAVKGICVKGGADLSRKEIEKYTEFVSRLGLKGLGWMKFKDNEISSPIAKFFSDDQKTQIKERFSASDGDLLLFAAAKESVVNQSLDHLRRQLAKDRDLIPKDTYKFLWVVDFPLFEWDEEEERYYSVHHPFTSPKEEDFNLLDSDPGKVRSNAYDLVLNGYEVGGGSQRIHDEAIQERIFKLLNLSEEDLKTRMGFFLEALKYGTPPHLGIAFGVDRLVMILCDQENIKDVIAFPKTHNASDLMTGSPSTVQISRLKELQIAATK